MIVDLLFGLFVYIMSNLFAAFTGYKEAVLFSRLGANAVKWNLHNLFLSERIAVYLMIIAAFFIHNIYWLSVSMVASILSFSFWHDGFYFIGKGTFSIKGLGFTSDTTTSNAPINFNWYERLTLKILSLFLFVIGFIFIK